MDEEKLQFLKNEFIPLLQKIDGSALGNWGQMNGQQMVEHICDAVKNASGKLVLPMVNQGEHLEKLRIFLFSEKPFRENTKNPLLPETPLALRRSGMEAAIEKLRAEFNYFFMVFENSPGLMTCNPIFGELDYAGNIQLLYKHGLHHLHQFGIEPTFK
jgi:hypothetical protein